MALLDKRFGLVPFFGVRTGCGYQKKGPDQGDRREEPFFKRGSFSPNTLAPFLESRRAAELQASRAAGQQSSRAVEQQSSRAEEQQSRSAGEQKSSRAGELESWRAGAQSVQNEGRDQGDQQEDPSCKRGFFSLSALVSSLFLDAFLFIHIYAKDVHPKKCDDAKMFGE